jgi:hypothetical protein
MRGGEAPTTPPGTSSEEDLMTKKKGTTKGTTANRDLSLRKGSGVKGGIMLTSALSNTVTAVGDALSTMARKQ